MAEFICDKITPIQLKVISQMMNQQPSRMPTLFVGHGSPMNAVQHNGYTQMLSQWASHFPVPKAILMVSAHWQTPGKTLVDGQEHPKTIHDFYNFPEELYQIQYPAMGAPDVAAEVVKAISARTVSINNEWGLDHGTWAVLKYLYPNADVPVLQLSIDYDAPAEFHYQLGQQLRGLRDQGILIVGSGNISHNLRTVEPYYGEEDHASQDWAQQFGDYVRDALQKRNDEALIHYKNEGEPAMMAAGYPDHYWPFLYVLGAAYPEEKVRITFEKYQLGTLDMLCCQFG